MKKTILAAVALILAGSMPSFAQTPRADYREFRQDQRIVRGAVRGDLNPREIHRLQRQQHRIDRAQRRAARDGYVSHREARQIERMQNRAGRNIARKTHNWR